jgi:hypothetical protein
MRKKHREKRDSGSAPKTSVIATSYCEMYNIAENAQLAWGRVLAMAKRARSDQTVGSFEKKHGLPPGTIRNKTGRDTRSDKKLGTIRSQAKKGKA